MGDKVLKIGTVHQCNCCLGSKTLHPLVSVIDLSKADLSAHTGIKFDFYTILLSECKCEAYMYGHQYYDFSDGTLLFLSPGESINMKENSKNFPSKGWILAFHPDLICGTPLGLNIHNYTFFSYLPEEALHISLREKQIILEFMDKINQELERCIDRHSKKIVSKYIELLLDYCIRFYERHPTDSPPEHHRSNRSRTSHRNILCAPGTMAGIHDTAHRIRTAPVNDNMQFYLYEYMRFSMLY